jgi:hypothetical protein
VRNPTNCDGPSGIDSESDFFIKHQKYTEALSFVFFSIGILLALGSVAIFTVQQETHFWLLLCAFMPGAIGGWLRNRARGVKEDQVPQSHNVAS